MTENKSVNLEILKTVAKALGELNEEVIYVGGAVVFLYATDNAADEARPTEDIDISVKISTYKEMNEFSEKLKMKNIHLDVESSITYRYKYDGIPIDFIPFEETPLGPSNSWLKPSFDNPLLIKIGEENIKIPTVAFFLANKWEAFENRGNDPRMSKDFEDIIYVLDNNTNFVKEIESSPQNVIAFLAEMANFILTHPSIDEIIECHLVEPERKNLIFQKLSAILIANRK